MKSLVLFGACLGVMLTPLVGEEGQDERTGAAAQQERGKDGSRGAGGRSVESRRGEGVERSKRGNQAQREGRLMKLDTDADGRVSKEEFFMLPRMAKLPGELREKLFGRFDADGSGFLDRQEMRGLRAAGKRRQRRELRALDLDGSGGVSLEEFSRGKIFSKFPIRKREQIFKRMDTDGDGEISPRDKPEGHSRAGRDSGGTQR